VLFPAKTFDILGFFIILFVVAVAQTARLQEGGAKQIFQRL
jgi:hypothetical protein